MSVRYNRGHIVAVNRCEQFVIFFGDVKLPVFKNMLDAALDELSFYAGVVRAVIVKKADVF